MRITEIPFKSIRGKGINLTDKPGRGWSGPIHLPLVAHLFGQPITVFNLSEWGALRFSEGAGDGYHYRPADANYPASLDDMQGQYTVVPWGQMQKITGCGNHTMLYRSGSVIILDFITKDQVDLRIKYRYQVHIPTSQPNIIEVHYYGCLSGYNTYVGAIATADVIAGWNIKENTIYAKKALRFDTTPITVEDEKPVVTKPETFYPSSTPEIEHNAPVTKPVGGDFLPPQSALTNWRTVYESNRGYRVQDK